MRETRPCRRSSAALEMAIIARLKKRRFDLRLSLEEVGSRIGVTGPAVWAWENQVSFPGSLAQFQAYASALDGTLQIALKLPGDARAEGAAL